MTLLVARTEACMAKRSTRRTTMQTTNKKRRSRKGPTIDELLASIAKETLHIDTLETRKSDALDFHDVAVWSVKAALEAAYHAGLAAAKEER